MLPTVRPDSRTREEQEKSFSPRLEGTGVIETDMDRCLQREQKKEVTFVKAAWSGV